jgi:hypothetical protein
VTIHSSFYGDKSRTVAIRQMEFGAVKDHRHAYKFYYES